jgi:hypothetical protein
LLLREKRQVGGENLAGLTEADVFNQLDKVDNIAPAGITLPAVESVILDVKSICRVSEFSLV